MNQPTGSDRLEPGPEYSGSGLTLTRKHLRSEQDAKNFIVSSRARRQQEDSDEGKWQNCLMIQLCSGPNKTADGPSENVRPTL